jgi:hypothetical protein
MRDRKLEIIGLGVAVLFVLLAMWNYASSYAPSTPLQQPYQQNSDGNDLTRVDYGNQIVITTKYLNPEVESPNAVFYVAMDTHWGDLFEYDFMELARLEIGNKSFTPVNWTESPQSWGHHRKGLLEFSNEALREIENSGTFRLVITGIEKDRVFEWKLS